MRVGLMAVSVEDKQRPDIDDRLRIATGSLTDTQACRCCSRHIVFANGTDPDLR